MNIEARGVAVAFLLCVACLMTTSAIQAPTPAPVRVLSSASGSKGEVRQGQFVVFDPRATFRVPEDTKVIVTFQWLGTPGKHHLQATWHGPADTSSSSGFDYNAQTREFGAYWQIPLGPDAALGHWRVDVQVDGLPAGSHLFEVVGPDAASPIAGPTKPLPLTRQELYLKALAGTVVVEALNAAGRVLSTSAGTLVDAETVATTYVAIDGAARVRVRTSQGDPIELASVLAFNRHQNWAMVKAPGLTGGTAIPPVTVRATIGTRCTSSAATGDGSFVATSGELVGTRDYPHAGPRLNVSFSSGDAAPGAPVLDEFGMLIGVAGVAVDTRALQRVYRMGEMLSQASQVLVLPIDVVRADGSGASLADLGTRGIFLAPVTLPDQVLGSGFSASFLKDGQRTQPVDERDHFSVKETKMTAFVTWDPKRSLKGLIVLRLLDDDNRVLTQTKPMKATLKPGSLSISSWQFGVPQAKGIYHAEVLLGSDLVWRGFFDVTD